MGISEQFGDKGVKGARSKAREIQHFTNRGSEIKRFCELLHEPRQQGAMLMFYGKSGHGKSRLLYELRSKYAKILPAGAWQRLSSAPPEDEGFKKCFLRGESKGRPLKHVIFLDFKGEADSLFSPWEKNLLKICFKLDYFIFPRFYFAYALYREFDNNPITEEEKANYFNTRDLQFYMDMLGQFTWGGLASVSRKFWEKIEPRLSTRRTKKAFKDGEFLTSLLRMSQNAPSEIPRLLPGFLGKDITDNIDQGNARFLLFQDTFEALAGEEQDITDLARRHMQRWFVDLCNALLSSPNVLVVMAGRDKLHWESFDSVWGKREFLEQHLVGPLSEQDAFRYLEKCEVEGDLFEAVYKLTGGIPIWLGIVVEYAIYFWESEGRKCTLADLEKDIGVWQKEEDILSQLLFYVSKTDVHHSNLLTYLSLCQSFTWDSYRCLGEALELEYSREKFGRICRMTFVYEEASIHGGFRYHPAVRPLLAKKIDNSLRFDIHKILFQRYMKAMDSEADPDIRFDYLCNAVYHQMRREENWDIFDRFFNEFLKKYALQDARELLDWVPDSMRVRDYFIRLVDLGDQYRKLGGTQNPYEIFLIGLELSKGLLKADAANAQAQRDLSISYEKLGNVCVQRGELSQAEERYEEGLKIRKKLAADPKDAQAQRDLSISLNKCGLYEEALAITTALLKDLGPNIDDLYQLACIYSGMKKTESALGYLRKAVELGCRDLSMKEDMDLKNIQDHPRFKPILEEMKGK